MQGFGKWKKLIQMWKQLDGGYTLMLVPHDGRSISKKDLHTRQMKKAASCIGIVALGTVGLVVLLSGMLYVRNLAKRKFLIPLYRGGSGISNPKIMKEQTLIVCKSLEILTRSWYTSLLAHPCPDKPIRAA